MPLHPPLASRRGSAPLRRAALLLLLTAAAWLAGAPPAAAQQNGGGTEAGSIQHPTLLNGREIDRQLAALYPLAMRDSGIAHGSVVLRYRVLAEGTVDSATVMVEEASNPAFVGPALSIVPRLRYEAAKVGGAPVAVWIRDHVFFRDSVQLPPDEGNYEMAAIETMPRLRNERAVIRETAARYPSALRESGVSGHVVVNFRLFENGTVDSTTVRIDLTTDPAFDAAARAVALRMRFTPARIGGRAVRAYVTRPIHFWNREQGR